MVRDLNEAGRARVRRASRPLNSAAARALDPCHRRVSRSLASLYWYNYDPNHYDAPGRFGYLRAGFRF